MISSIKKHLIHIPGWSTKNKYLVIESDDWGSISMASKESFDKLSSKYSIIKNNAFTQYDALETNEDLTRLFETLNEFSDKNGNPPILTACSLVANPDFEKIAQSNFKNYFYESVTDTYKKNKNSEDCLHLIKKGIETGVYFPQFHGREHLNPTEWLKSLNSGSSLELDAFSTKSLLALSKPIFSKRRRGYMSAFDYEDEDEFQTFKDIIHDGLKLFKTIYGFESKSFVAPTSVRSTRMDEWLKEGGILYHQMGQQITPKAEGYRQIDKIWGATNKYGQIYWRRNSKFEPSSDSNLDWVGKVMQDMKVAFKWGKPIVISSHRVNYIGSIDTKNREQNLRLLHELLKRAIQTYPDIEFISSARLGEIISKDRQHKLYV